MINKIFHIIRGNAKVDIFPVMKNSDVKNNFEFYHHKEMNQSSSIQNNIKTIPEKLDCIDKFLHMSTEQMKSNYFHCFIKNYIFFLGGIFGTPNVFFYFLFCLPFLSTL
jgi:hypothetical protein